MLPVALFIVMGWGGINWMGWVGRWSKRSFSLLILRYNQRYVDIYISIHKEIVRSNILWVLNFGKVSVQEAIIRKPPQGYIFFKSYLESTIMSVFWGLILGSFRIIFKGISWYKIEGNFNFLVNLFFGPNHFLKGFII